MEISVEPSKTYAVTTSGSCTVTDADGLELCTASSGSQAFFVATTPTVTISDDGAKVSRATFNYALAVAGLLGGGADKLPAGYTRVEYLASTGTQYIDTGVELNNASIVRSRFRVLSGHKYGFIFGARYAASVRAYCIYLDGTNTWLNYGSQSDKTSYPLLTKNVDYVFQAAANVWTFNRESIVLNTEPAFNAGKCFIFNMCANGTVDSRYFIGRVYRFEIVNGSERHKYIPVVEEATGTPGLYDTVGRVFKTNMGTGDFTYPTKSSTYAMRRVLPDWGKLTPHGLRRLYHAPADYEGDIYDYALANGYKQIVEPEQPEEGCWTPVWHDREDCIELEWVETEPPEDELSNVE